MDTMYGKMYFLNPARPECREWIVGLYEILVENYDVDEATAAKDAESWCEKLKECNLLVDEK